MGKKELRNETDSCLENAMKAVRNQRKTGLFVFGSALILGTFLFLVLGYTYMQNTWENLISRHPEGKNLYQLHLETSAPSVEPTQNASSVPQPQSTEPVAIPAIQAESTAQQQAGSIAQQQVDSTAQQQVLDSQIPGPASMPPTAETSPIPAQQAESPAITAEETGYQEVEPGSTPEPSEYENIPAPKHHVRKHKTARHKARGNYAGTKRHYREVRYIRYVPEQQTYHGEQPNYHYGFPAVSN